MTLTPEQSEQIKEQLIAQIEKLPQENKQEIKQHILELNEEQLEEFLKQNKIKISESGQLLQEPAKGTSKQTTNPCIFCAIAGNQVPSYKLAENKKAVAILEINPLSRGHSMIVPLEHIKTEKLPKPALSLAQKIIKIIKTKLKPEDIKMETTSIQGHSLINIIPIYKNEKLEKRQLNESELKQLQSKLEIKKRSSRKTDSKKQTKNKSQNLIDPHLPQISFRIP
ncbi:MAG: hypothetical protein WCX73_04555 [Candidatus Pacearchaeota archaeon]|jgi:histidine triad (HIT) family protein